jgi:hypothetical protein
LLRHATLVRNLPGIERRGLLCAKSKGRRPVVWLHTPAKSFWAALHAIKRHGRRAEAVLILLVDVPRAWLRKNRKGPWYSVATFLPTASGACSASPNWPAPAPPEQRNGAGKRHLSQPRHRRPQETHPCSD